MKPLSVLKLAPESREQVDMFASQIIQEIENGNEDALDILLRIKGFVSALELIKENIKDKALEEAGRYGKGAHNIKGFTFNIQEAGIKYNYAATNDPLWIKYKTQLDERQTLLKGIKEPIKIVDEDSGEEITVAPPLKTSTTTVAIEMKYGTLAEMI